MEYLNKIELRGNVGTVRLQTFNGRTVAYLSLATTRVFRNGSGDPVMDTTWHNVNVWEGRDVDDLKTLKKGDKVYVCGRMLARKFTGNDGTERTSYEVTANTLHTIDDPTPFSYEA